MMTDNKKEVDQNDEPMTDEQITVEDQEPVTEEDAPDEEVLVLKDKYLRLMAEFENFKRRTFREKLESKATAARETVMALLPVMDDFDRAKLVADDESTNEEFSDGVSLVYHKLHAVMKNLGVESMVTNGEPFDPEYHEAMTEIPASSDDMKGKIIDTIEKGYTLNDKIIRHAKVVVGK